MNQKDLLQKIKEASIKEKRRILFSFGDGYTEEACIIDSMSLIHSSVDKIDINPKVKLEKLTENQIDQSSNSLKRKSENENSKNNVKNSKKNWTGIIFLELDFS